MQQLFQGLIVAGQLQADDFKLAKEKALQSSLTIDLTTNKSGS
jgi:hypothetical protein